MSAVPLSVLAPVAGKTVDISGVDDPVFAAGLVGPGLAILPDAELGRQVVAPVSGTIVKLHPHAFVVKVPDGRAILVHLGINTVQLDGAGFTLHVAQGDAVTQGDVLITWDPTEIERGGRSSVCPVVALGATPDVITAVDSADVTASQELFTWS
ncbi:PTS system, N-acetylglucosamine-specific IIA component [Sanguibacter gelidistatuariae]|uniref:PTS system, N-acetylglucosamine-specific IIA component n=1 Tax=Sanguibacter gelidistatuariae TaxID=1814289 RepID=A0A1G6UJ14_9MICO|nr:PTS glucose transporter subunit IIA [Sanguibacter gelidistatuariae]SDD41261.1 PTS system, N-acetylglucosamine-specific IIA component [Sanguibacter gelidistatuariae]